MVRQHVSPLDAAYILLIPISMLEEHDQLVWPYTKEGTTMVWSVYHWLKETTEDRDGTVHDNGQGSNELWKGIYGEKTIPKVKSYMWKLTTNTITVKSNLIRRDFLNVTPDCPICGKLETREHMLFECRWTHAVWFRMLGILGINQTGRSIEQWLHERTQLYEGCETG